MSKWPRMGGLTGGTNKDLDSLDGSTLSGGDLAFVYLAGELYLYELVADSGAAESSPAVIAPDNNAGAKRWILRTRIPMLGTAAAKDAGTGVGQLLMFAEAGLLPALDASNLTNLPGGDTTDLQRNISILAYHLLNSQNLTAMKMANGLVDDFEDEDFVQASTFAYDAARDCYTAAMPYIKPSTYTWNNAWTLRTGQTLHGAYVHQFTAGQKVKKFRMKVTKTGAPTGTLSGHIGGASGSIPTAVPNGTLASGSSVDISTITEGGEQWVEFTFDTPWLCPSDGLYSVYFMSNFTFSDASNYLTLGLNSTGDVNVQNTCLPGNCAFHQGSSWDGNNKWNDVLWEIYDDSATSQPSIESKSITASAQPSKAMVTVFLDTQNTLDLGTDFEVHVSRDGGTTWFAGTLTEVGSGYEFGKLLESNEIALSGADGTAMRYKLKLLDDAIALDLHGMSIMWGT